MYQMTSLTFSIHPFSSTLLLGLWAGSAAGGGAKALREGVEQKRSEAQRTGS